MWADVRKRLNASRAELGVTAGALYPDLPRVASTALLTRPGWVADAPVPLEDVRLEWEPAPAPPVVVDPVDGLPEGFRTYAEAMAALAPPAVFENRPAYRLLDADVDGRRLRYGPAHYFDGVNVGEAVAHELAEGVGGLPLRARVGDPTDLARRTALTAITTVTIRDGHAPSYVLHWRDPEKVAHAGGLRQVMPVGLFQPLVDAVADLDPWGSMKREYSEEFLGNDEVARWDDPGYTALSHSLDAVRAEGRLRAFFLGLGTDPLTLAVDLLVAVVVDADVFDALFGAMVRENDEGLVSTAPFDGTVPQRMQPAGAAALELAWRHRPVLLRRG